MDNWSKAIEEFRNHVANCPSCARKAFGVIADNTFTSTVRTNVSGNTATTNNVSYPDINFG